MSGGKGGASVGDFLQYARSKGKGHDLFTHSESKSKQAHTESSKRTQRVVAMPPLPFTLSSAKDKKQSSKSADSFKKRVFTSCEELRTLIQPTEEDVEKAYTCEQKSDDWFNYRTDRLTGSSFGAAIRHNPHTKPDALLQRMLWGEFCESRHTIHGTFYEDEARQAYVLYKLLKLSTLVNQDNDGAQAECDRTRLQESTDSSTAIAAEKGTAKTCWYDDMPSTPSFDPEEIVYFDEPPLKPDVLAAAKGVCQREDEAKKVSAPYIDTISGKINVPFKCWECGIMLRNDMWHVGCSPDGLVEECGSEGCMEIKCPSSKREFYVKDPRYSSTGIPAYYYDQIQGLMHFSGRKWCDFVVYVVVPDSLERKMWVRRYYYEEAYCTSVLFPQLHSFYFDRYVPLRIAQIKGNLPYGSIKMPPRLSPLLMASLVMVEQPRALPQQEHLDDVAAGEASELPQTQGPESNTQSVTQDFAVSAENVPQCSAGVELGSQVPEAPVDEPAITAQHVQDKRNELRETEDMISPSKVSEEVNHLGEMSTSGDLLRPSCVRPHMTSTCVEHDEQANPTLLSAFILDIETTGLSVITSKVIQLSCLFVDVHETGYTTRCTFDRYVNPGTAIPPNITSLTGISDAMVSDQPPFLHVWKDFASWMHTCCGRLQKRCIVVAHNGFNYDFPLLQRESCTASEQVGNISLSFEDLLKSCKLWAKIDSLKLAKHNVSVSTWPFDLMKTDTGIHSFRLNSLHHGVAGCGVENAHSALVDAKALATVCFHQRSPLRTMIVSLVEGDRDVYDGVVSLCHEIRKRTRSSEQQKFSCAESISLARHEIESCRDWAELELKLEKIDLKMKPSGGGLALWEISTDKRVCKSSEVGWSYSTLVKRFKCPMPGHPLRMQHLLDPAE